MMTAKHFKAIAEIIDTQTHKGRISVHKLGLVEALAEFFSTQNPNFDRNRFYQACGFEQGVSNPY